MSLVRTLALCSVVLLSGCTFVKPTEQAVSVRIGAAEDVANCKRLGQTTVSTLATMAGLPRYESSIQDELNTLARNSGANNAVLTDDSSASPMVGSCGKRSARGRSRTPQPASQPSPPAISLCGVFSESC